MLAWLEQAGIPFALHRHPAAFTVEEARLHTGHLPGAHTKNLFLEDRTGGLWLVTCREAQPVKVNGLARLLGCPRLSFASPERLHEALGVLPGSVTILALVHDRARRVRPILDAGLLAHEHVNVHPLVNTATCTLRTADLERLLAMTGHTARILDLDRTLAA
jgi:Ala-tRNA(Pro) deacylase